jgi:hypothetical protein
MYSKAGLKGREGSKKLMREELEWNGMGCEEAAIG